MCEWVHLLLVRRSERQSTRASVEFQSRVILVGPFGASPVRSGSWDRRAEGSAAVPSPGRRELADNLPAGLDLRSTIRTRSTWYTEGISVSGLHEAISDFFSCVPGLSPLSLNVTR